MFTFDFQIWLVWRLFFGMNFICYTLSEKYILVKLCYCLCVEFLTFLCYTKQNKFFGEFLVMKKLILPVLFILILTLLVACVTVMPQFKQPINENLNSGNSGNNSASQNGLPTEIIYNYQGREFTVAMYNHEMFLPEPDSSPLSNQILQRNVRVEQAYNIKIKALDGLTKENFVSELNKRYNAGLFCGDLLVIPNYMMPLFISQNQLMSVKALPFVDLNADCFDKAATDSATIGNFVHAVYGDFTYLADKSVCVFFNKDLVQSNDLTSPYQMEKGDEWTWDNFDTMAKTVRIDTNKNRKADFEDIFGLSSSYSKADITDIVWAACGEAFFDNNPPYSPKMIFDTEKTQNIIDKIRRLLYNDVSKIYINDTKSVSGYDLFLEGRSVFCIAPLDSADEVSAAGINFGIMPLPKLDTQDDYHSFADSSRLAVCVMNNIPDSEFSGRILQKIAEESDFDSIDFCKKYYTTNFLTDNSSAVMLDKIFHNPYYDLATTLGDCYPEIASASNDIIFSHVSTGISFDNLYQQNLKRFDSFAKTSFTYKGE